MSLPHEYHLMLGTNLISQLEITEKSCSWRSRKNKNSATTPPTPPPPLGFWRSRKRLKKFNNLNLAALHFGERPNRDDIAKMEGRAVRRLIERRSCASYPDSSISDKSFLMLSSHLRFGFPLLLSPAPPSPSLSCLRILLFSIHAHTTYFNLLSCTFLDISPTFVAPLILYFLILSSLVTPLIHLNILISATSNFFSCAFFSAYLSAPYITAGLTTVLYTFP